MGKLSDLINFYSWDSLGNDIEELKRKSPKYFYSFFEMISGFPSDGEHLAILIYWINFRKGVLVEKENPEDVNDLTEDHLFNCTIKHLSNIGFVLTSSCENTLKNYKNKFSEEEIDLLLKKIRSSRKIEELISIYLHVIK